jgi:hypothetical protein
LFRTIGQDNLLKRGFELLPAFVNAKLPSGFYEPLGLLFVSQLRFRLCFFGAPAFAIRWPLANELPYILDACRQRPSRRALLVQHHSRQARSGSNNENRTHTNIGADVSLCNADRQPFMPRLKIE